MAILEKSVWVKLNGNNISYYEELGYEINRNKNKWGKTTIPANTKLLVEMKDLPKQSNIKVTKVCDFCYCEIKVQYCHLTLSRENGDGKDRCRKCSFSYIGETRKKNLPYEKSLHNFCVMNNKKHLLLEYSSKNKRNTKKISRGSQEEIIWDCLTCHTEYKTSVYNRTKSNPSSCPYCSCLWNTDPNVARLLKYQDDGYSVTRGSGKKRTFVCDKCDYEKDIRIFEIVRRGFACERCSDNVSYAERIVVNLLIQLKVSFEKEKTFSWSKNISGNLRNSKRYDFYIPSENCIIETHGRQHYEFNGFNYCSGKSLEDEIENDILKRNLAIGNGIARYIEIDCKESDFNYIRKSIEISLLSSIFDFSLVDWGLCEEEASSTLVKEVSAEWNNGNKSVTRLSGVFHLSDVSVRKYLKMAASIGWCDYKPRNKTRGVIQLSKSGIFIKQWDSILNAATSLNISNTGITNVCKGRQKSTAGYKWMYTEDYEASLVNQ